MESGLYVPLLSLLVWLPSVGALLCLVCARTPWLSRVVALVTSLLVFLLAASEFYQHRLASGWQHFEDLSWIAPFGIRYTLGMDGLSLLLVLLSAFLFPLAVLISWRLEKRAGLFFALLLAMETGVLGVFLALDLVLFYLFWEVMLIPMFLLIGIWGHGRRIYSAVKFFLFTLAGSLLMLLALIALHLFHLDQTGVSTFSLFALQQTRVPEGWQLWLFAGFLLAFIVKVPLFPLHTWLPDAHGDAPTAGSVILAGLLLKTGVYGLLRYAFPLFPEAALSSLPWLAFLGIVGIFYTALIAYVQKDAKRLIAYSSVAHLGFVILGIAALEQTALEGSLLQLVNHGISTGALFALVGMIDARAKTRQIGDLGGLWSRVPVLSCFFLFFCLASLGLPGLNNFVGEILILLGTFRAEPLWAALALPGVVLAAAYMLRLVQGVLWGEARSSEPWNDMSAREGLVLVPLAVLVLWLGLYPSTFLAPLEAPAAELLRLLEAPLQVAGGAP